jgi:hypothetical protein
MPSLPLSTGDIASCRHVADAFLPGTAVILTQGMTSDGQGGYVDAYNASGTVAARLASERLRGDVESSAGGRLAEVGSWVLTVPAGTTVGETDRVRFDSIVYEVSEVLTRVPEEISRRVRLKEID